MNKKRIVTIGGGSGQSVLLTGLRDVDEIEITALVSMADNGGSTGRLRDELGVLPPGDILKCVLALSKNREYARKLLLRRFGKHERLKGHNAGNMLLTMLSQYLDDLPAGVDALREILESSGRVLPITTDKVTLGAELEDGSFLFGESLIDLPKDKNRKGIKRVFLVPHSNNESVNAHSPAIEAIEQADFLIIGPGDLYTSIIPNFLVSGVKEAIVSARARVIYLVNLMTKSGETDNFLGKDFIRKIEDYIGRKVNVVVSNASRPDEGILKRYIEQNSNYVEFGENDFDDGEIMVKEDILNSSGGVIRHDSQKLATLIKKLIKD